MLSSEPLPIVSLRHELRNKISIVRRSADMLEMERKPPLRTSVERRSDAAGPPRRDRTDRFPDTDSLRAWPQGRGCRSGC